MIVRESEAEAWDAADKLIQHVDDESIAAAQKKFPAWIRSARAAWRAAWRQPRQAGDRPNLWAGVGLVRGGAGTALVGDPATVAGAHPNIRRSASKPSSSPAIRIWRKRTGSPNWCSRYCRGATANVTPIRVNTGPFGEIIANEHRPRVKAAKT